MTMDWKMDKLEKEVGAIARKEVEERKAQGLPITDEWLDALERKHYGRAKLDLKAETNERA